MARPRSSSPAGGKQRARAVETCQHGRGDARRVEGVEALPHPGEVEPSGSGEQVGALREAGERLVCGRDEGVGAKGERMRRERRVEAEVGAPGLVDEQRDARRVRQPGDRADVAHHAYEVRLHEEDRPRVRMRGQGRLDPGAGTAEGEAGLGVDVGPHPDRI